jgi:hypothetical protein
MWQLKQISLLQDAKLVAKLHGKGLLRQAIEIVRLKKANPSIGATDYYTFRLYDREYVSESEAERYLGWRSEIDLAYALNLRTMVMPGWDKFTLALYARAFDLPVAKLIALYRPGLRPVSGIADVVLDGPERLRDWLRTQIMWPLFAKPSYSQQGFGCYNLSGYDPDQDALITKGGRKILVDEFVAEIMGKPGQRFYEPEMGYLFQEVLHPHVDIARLQGNDTISSVRVILVQDARGVDFVGGAFRIATGNNELDNFRSGATGNLAATIDFETGRVSKAVNGIWPRAEIVTTIPGTGQSIEGFVLPEWPRVLALCKTAAAIFPLMHIQHWDIAITDKGPRFQELNDVGSLIGGQLWGSGIVTPRLRDLLRQYGSDRFPWLKKA